MERSAREQLVIEHFKSGLDVDLRRHVQFQHPDSLERALAVGLEYEVMDEGRDKSRKPVVAAIQSTVTPPPGSPQTLEQLTSLTEKSIKATQNLAENMLKMQQMFADGQKPGRGSTRDGSQIECYNCHGKGHIARNCKNRKNSQNQGYDRSYLNPATRPENA